MYTYVAVSDNKSSLGLGNRLVKHSYDLYLPLPPTNYKLSALSGALFIANYG